MWPQPAEKTKVPNRRGRHCSKESGCQWQYLYVEKNSTEQKIIRLTPCLRGGLISLQMPHWCGGFAAGGPNQETPKGARL
jgi:hypothetical protein